ncbi:hypothetical protein NMY22_g558 [Coprinellus aureogranulatus]|nr:hypothetical protein NMY22_g558 [Coprinellus aureogranulatus]
MGPPPVTVYLTTIASQPALRKRQEYLLRILQAKKIPFKSYDLASDEDAKKLWRRRAPAGKEQLPGILVGGKFVGTFQQLCVENLLTTAMFNNLPSSEEAVEFDELNQFLKRNEEWDEDLEPPSLPAQPIGVPGAQTPMEMTPERIKAKVIAGQPSPPNLRKTPVPTPVNKEPAGFRMSVGGELGGFGLDGVKVTQDELRDLVSQLGLGGDDAEELVRGLGNSEDKRNSSSNKAPVSVKPSAIVQAQPKPLAPLRTKSSKASSLHKEKVKEPAPAPPTPKSAGAPAVDKAPELTAIAHPPITNEPAQNPSWQPTVPDNVPQTPQKDDTPKELRPIRVEQMARRMPSNRSEDTLAVDMGSPTSKVEVPYSPLTPHTLVGEQETKLLYKSTEPATTPTMSEGFYEKVEEPEQKESQGFKAMLRRLFCMQ